MLDSRPASPTSRDLSLIASLETFSHHSVSSLHELGEFTKVTCKVLVKKRYLCVTVFLWLGLQGEFLRNKARGTEYSESSFGDPRVLT